MKTSILTLCTFLISTMASAQALQKPTFQLDMPAPETSAASSKFGSMFLKAGDIIKYVVGTKASPWTNIIPGKLYTLKGALSKLNKFIKI